MAKPEHTITISHGFSIANIILPVVSILASLTFLPTAAHQKITQTRTPSQSGPGNSQIPHVFIALYGLLYSLVSHVGLVVACVRGTWDWILTLPHSAGIPNKALPPTPLQIQWDKSNRNVLLCNFMGTTSSLDLGELTRVYLQCSWWLWYSICFWSPQVSGAEFSFMVLLTLWLLFTNRLLGSRPLSCSRKCFHFFGHGMSLPHTRVSCSFIVSLCGHLGWSVLLQV